MDEDFCPHLFGDLPKSACSIAWPHGCNAVRPEGPVNGKKRATKPQPTLADLQDRDVPVDSIDGRVDAIIRGEWCPRCHSMIESAHLGCQCVRDQRKASDFGAIDLMVEEAETDEERAFAISCAAGARRRAILRYGRDVPSEYDGVPLATMERLEARKASGIEPNWKKPGVYDPEELPV